MRRILFFILYITTLAGILYSCAKYKDAKGYTDPLLTNPYCNDPNAVNYNVGFPGKPDSTVCIYPSDLFVGTYVYHDSISNDSLYLRMDSLVLHVFDSSVGSHFKIRINGFCPNDTTSPLFLTASTIKIATVDTFFVDTTTLEGGQYTCDNLYDTITGTITIDALDSTLLHIQFQVNSDTGISYHTGSARKQ